MRIASRFERVWEMVWKEFLQIFRDPKLRRIIFVAPVIQLMVFGYAVSTDVRHTTTFVVDHDRSSLSRDLLANFTASDYFLITGRSDDLRDLERALDHGDAIVGVVIGPGFGAAVAGGEGATIQVVVDGTNSNIATVAKGYAERIVQRWGLARTTEPAGLAVQLDERAWFNPNLESRNYNVPAVIGAIIMLICLLLTALAIVREREAGTLEQLMVTPLTAGELIAGKTLPFAMIGLLDLLLVTGVALFWFRIPFEGNFMLLLAGSVLYLVSGLGIGLLISTISKTQQEAFMSSFLVFMPTILLSGFMFPVSSMPRIFQTITLINPMRHYLEIVRGVFLKGAPFEAMWPQFAALLAIGLILLAFAVHRFEERSG
jgi:ABC-2 type transport system permease protein